MNNFLLNNTSVYLGGQCEWDIVLDKNKEEFEISGFQLAPISNNVPYNKKGSINILNDNHSDTLKEFSNSLKGSFWSTEFNADTYVTDDYGNIDINIDSSLIAGLKRGFDYEIYKKQFCFFQPIWLEDIPENSYLRFKFTVYPYENKNAILGARYVDFKLKDNYKYQFHNRFVQYLNDWFSYIHIVKTDDNEGNNRVMYIDLQNEKAYLSGISTITGQLNNHCNCDYVVSNLLLYERPKVETDYILSSLFKNHNMITSQLFNLNFYFNIEDILDKFIFNQLIAQKIYIKCDCCLIEKNGEVIQLENKSLFTNYNEIKKSSFNPFIFLDDIEFDDTGLGIIKDWKYEILPKNDINDNVLNYLNDYEVKNVKDINKITQNIYHWDYSNTTDKNFNLYNGYQYIYKDFTTSNNLNDINRSVDEEEQIIYRFDPKEIKYSNGISVLSLPDKYLGSGELAWVNPKQILYINSNPTDSDTGGNLIKKIKSTISLKLVNKGVSGIVYNNSLSIETANNAWGTKIDASKIAEKFFPNDTFDLNDYNSSYNKIALVYIKNSIGPIGSSTSLDWGDDIESSINSFYKIIEISDSDSQHLIIGLDFKTAVLFTDNQDCLMLDTILNLCNNYYNNHINTLQDTDKKILRHILITLNGIKESVVEGNAGGFYQFNTDICVGNNDINEKIYYKLDENNTYVYRLNGLLRPSFLEQNSQNHNKFYGLLVNENSPQLILDDDGKFVKYKDLENPEGKYIDKGLFEISYPGWGWRYLLAEELNFVLKKNTLDDSSSLNELIIDYLSKIYNIDTESAQKIYNLYFTEFDYEYEYDKENVQTVYKIKLILK